MSRFSCSKGCEPASFIAPASCYHQSIIVDENGDIKEWGDDGKEIEYLYTDHLTCCECGEKATETLPASVLTISAGDLLISGGIKVNFDSPNESVDIHWSDEEGDVTHLTMGAARGLFQGLKKVLEQHKDLPDDAEYPPITDEEIKRMKIRRGY